MSDDDISKRQPDDVDKAFPEPAFARRSTGTGAAEHVSRPSPSVDVGSGPLYALDDAPRPRRGKWLLLAILLAVAIYWFWR